MVCFSNMNGFFFFCGVVVTENVSDSSHNFTPLFAKG